MIELSNLEILYLSITVFITQIIFIGCRTWNVRAIAQKNIKEVLVSSGLVHLSWLVSIAIGASTTTQIMIEFKWQYMPIIFFSLIGGLIGSYIPLRKKLE